MNKKLHRKEKRKEAQQASRAANPNLLALEEAARERKSGASQRTAAHAGSAEPKTQAEQLFQGQNHPSKKKKIPRLEQWVEVRIRNGQAVTQLYPSNDKLIKHGQKLLPPPNRVYRRLHFPDGIPSEYDWVGVASEQHRKQGGVGLQRMTVPMWLDAIKCEAGIPGGHIGPVVTLPSEKRECECETCQTNRTVFAELEADAKAAGRPHDVDSLVRYTHERDLT